MNRRLRRLSAIMLLVIMSLPIGAPLVAASTPDVQVQGVFVARPDSAFPYAALMNWANASDLQYSNYNLTWAPEYLANPDITGVTVTPLPAPAIIKESTTSLEAVQRVRFTENDVLDGVSQSWWRAPIGNISSGSTVTLVIYRADSSTVNLSSISSGIVFDDPSLAQKVWNETLTVSSAFSFQYRPFTIAAAYGPPVWVNLTPTLRDASVRDDMPSSARGLVNELNVQASTPTQYAYFQYNLTSLPPGSRIVAANLSVDRWQQFIGGTLSTYRPFSSWGESTITWNNQPSVDLMSPLSSLRVDCPFPGFGYLCSSDTRLSLNMTGAVTADMAAGTSLGARVMYDPLQPILNGTQAFSHLWPREQSDASLRPTLWVEYRPATIYFAFSLLSVYAPLFPNKDYWAYWHVTSPGAHDFHLYYTPGDMNNDRRYQSWYKVASGSTVSVPVDLDESVVMTRGMSGGYAGLGLDCATYGQTCIVSPATSLDRALWYYNAWTGSVAVTNTPGNYVYANVVLPFVSTRANNTVAGDSILWLGFSDHAGIGLSCNGVSTPNCPVYWNGTLSKQVMSVNVSALAVAFPEYLGKHVSSVTYELRLNYWVTQGWSYLSASNGTKYVQLCLFGSPTPCVNMGFGLYGYFSVDHFFFENTERSIILVPIEQPDNEMGILQAWQQWQTQVTTAQQICNIEFVIGHIPIAAEMVNTILNNACITQGIMDRNEWIMHSIFEPLATFFSPVTNFLFAIGAWVWDLFMFVVKAIQWFLYWGAKIINIFIVLIVWIIVFMAPNYVGKAFQVWAKEGMSTPAMRKTLQEGWSNVWSVIQLVLSLVMIVVGAVSAIAGILPL